MTNFAHACTLKENLPSSYLMTSPLEGAPLSNPEAPVTQREIEHFCAQGLFPAIDYLTKKEFVWTAPAYAWATYESMYNSVAKLVDNIVIGGKGQFPNKVS